MEEMIFKIEKLLKETRETKLKEEKRKKDSFSHPFNVRDLIWSEEYWHSRFIVSLLNTNWDYGCAAKFLDEFCKMTKTDFVCKNASFAIGNPYIGPPYNYDIFIEQLDGKKVIVIVNKIYSGDKVGQLLKYKECCQKEYGSGNWKIFYLTLDGHEPSEYSTGKKLKKNKDYFTISYKDDIRNWLECCKKIAKDKKLQYEVLFGNREVSVDIEWYIDLIKQITKDLRGEVKNEIVELLEKGSNLILAEEMVSKIEDAKFDLLKNRIFPILEENCGLTDFNFGESFTEDNRLSFSIKNKKWGNLYICLRFNAYEYRDFCIGITQKGKTPASVKNFIKEQCCGNEKQNEQWLLYDYISGYRNWDAQTFCNIIKNIDKFCNAINEKVARYSKIIEGALYQG